MKVLITTDWYKPTINGVVTSVSMLKEELEKRGHEVRILTLEQKDPTPPERNVYILDSISAGKIYPEARVNLHANRWIINDILRWNPDIIHSQCEFSTFITARKIARYRSTPIVHTYHTVYEDYTHYFSPSQAFGQKAVRTFTRFILDKVDAVIVPTGKVKKMLLAYEVAEPISVIPTGIDISSFKKPISEEVLQEIRTRYGIKKDDFLLLSLGRLAKEKNITELFDFIARKQDPHIKLMIVGDGPYAKELKEQARNKNLLDNVIFTGPVEPHETSIYYHLGDLFVSASTSETQGLTYIEALASGTPALCRKDPCLEDVIINHHNGYQYEGEEDFNYFLEKVRKNPSYKPYLMKNAEDSVEKVSKEHFADKVLKVYQDTIEKDEPRKNKIIEKIKSFAIIYK